MDSVGYFLTRIRNAGFARHEKVDMPATKLRVELAKVLVKSGFIRSYKVAKDSKQGVMRVYLKYDEAGAHAITNLSLVSRPGKRVYVKTSEIPVVRTGLGLAVVSTSKGLMTGVEAQKEKIGGEIICKVW